MKVDPKKATRLPDECMDTTEPVEPAGISMGKPTPKQFGDHILPSDQKIMSVSKFDFLIPS